MWNLGKHGRASISFLGNGMIILFNLWQYGWEYPWPNKHRFALSFHNFFFLIMNMKIYMSLAMFGWPILILEHTIVYPGRCCSWICWGSQFKLWKAVSFWIFCTNLLSKLESLSQILRPISIILSPVRDYLPYQQYKILQEYCKILLSFNKIQRNLGETLSCWGYWSQT